MKRTLNTQSISWFVDLRTWGQLDLDPPYQRKSVWNQAYREHFIDTILRDYPSPTIFVSRRVVDGRTRYAVIDGKQRLEAILDFRADRFPTPTGNDAWAGRVYSELAPDYQEAFNRYRLYVEEIDDAAPQELDNAFDRLNRNVAKLNAQELRNAKWDGAFIHLMEQLAGDAFWAKIGLATPARIRRMLDIEYVSEIFLLTMHGIQDGKEAIDQLYADYDEEVPDVDVHRARYEQCKETLKTLDIALCGTRYRNLADFYSLWAAVLQTIDQKKTIVYAPTRRELSEFADRLATDVAPDTAESKYLLAARQGSNKGANREYRTSVLRELIHTR